MIPPEVESWLPKTIEDAIKFYASVHAFADQNQLLKAKRNLCKNDLFYLLIHPLRRIDMLHPWLFDRCREVQRNPNGYLDLWAREHYKSTIITFAKTIQDILCDPELTVGIFSHTRPIAKGFMRQIKREFEGNEEIKSLFSDILFQSPESESPQWSEDNGIIIKRKGNPKEATIEAWGLVDGQPTSKHFKLRVYDDVVTRESVTTSEQITKTTEAWELSGNLGTENGYARYIGTRYHLNDTYSEMIKRGSVKVRLHPATHNGRMDGDPVLFTQKTWDTKKRDTSRKTIAAQQLQNPLADEDAVFTTLWLRPYEVRPRYLNIAIMCDPSRGRNATSDNTAIAVIGVAQNFNPYFLDGYCHRMSLSQRWAAIRDLYRKWSREPGIQSVSVGYERYGSQSDDEYFQERMEIENKVLPKEQQLWFDIQELNWTFEGTKGEQGKKARVERLEPDFRNSRFYLPLAIWKDGRPCTWHVDDNPDSKTFQQIIYNDFEGFTKLQRQAVDGGSNDLVAKCIKRLDSEKKVYDLTDRFIEEYKTFPFGAHDDLIDVASRLYDMEIRPPIIIPPGSLEPRTYHDS